MTDLFGHTPTPKARVGEGNGKLLGHLANGMSKAEIKRNLDAGLYPDTHPAILKEAGL